MIFLCPLPVTLGLSQVLYTRNSLQPDVNTPIYAGRTGNYFLTAGISLFLQGEFLALGDLSAGAGQEVKCTCEWVGVRNRRLMRLHCP